MSSEAAYWKENYNAVVAERDRLAAELERSNAAHILKDYLKREQQRELKQYRQAIESGLFVKLPPYEETNYNGLKIKYHVLKASNGEIVENCFVLRPDKDPVARCALMVYAMATDNEFLSRDIRQWHERLEADAEQALKGDATDGI